MIPTTSDLHAELPGNEGARIGLMASQLADSLALPTLQQLQDATKDVEGTLERIRAERRERGELLAAVVRLAGWALNGMVLGAEGAGTAALAKGVQRVLDRMQAKLDEEETE